MPGPSVYIETIVVSYVTARPSRDIIVAAHQQITIEWWENTLLLCEPFVSPVVIEEAARGDKHAAKLRLERIAGFPALELRSHSCRPDKGNDSRHQYVTRHSYTHNLYAGRTDGGVICGRML